MNKKQQTKLFNRLNEMEIEHHLKMLKQTLMAYSYSEEVRHNNYLVSMHVFQSLKTVDALIAELDSLIEKSEGWESNVI